MDYLPDDRFEAWFKSLDKHGDGQIDMAEMANYLKSLSDKIERTEFLRTSDYGTFGLNAAKKKRELTVADVIGV
jgi:hypothetical protein